MVTRLVSGRLLTSFVQTRFVLIPACAPLAGARWPSLYELNLKSEVGAVDVRQGTYKA